MKQIALFILVLGCHSSLAAPLLIFDTHLHYNLDARSSLSVEQVIERLDQSGVARALVSSTDNLGTELLIEAAPDRFLPALRPYRRAGEIKSWMYDETVVPYLREQLQKNRYVAMGEFHAFEPHVALPTVQALIAMAREHNLVLHIHGDRGAVNQLFLSWPQARVLWAHAGFDDAEIVAEALDEHSNLWVDLSHRPDISTWAGLAPQWQQLFLQYPDRFLLGSDTYTLERWQKLGFYMLDARDWLSTLPAHVAKKIAHENAAELLGIR